MGLLDPPGRLPPVASKPYALLGDAAMWPYMSGRLNADAAPCDILVVSDSTAEGWGATALNRRWVNRFLSLQRAKYQPSGVAGGAGFVPPAWGATGVVIPAPATISGATNPTPSFGPGGRARGVGTAASVTWTVQGTSVDVLYATGSGSGTMSVSIDGGAATTFSTTATSPGSDAVARRFTFGARGSHTVAVTSTSGTVYVDGLMVYDQDETAGLRLWEAGHSGWATSDYVQYLATSSGTQPFAKQVATIQPKLVFLSLLENDYLHNIDPAVTSANLLTIIAQIRANCTYPPSIVLTANYEAIHDSAGFTGPGLLPWSGYVGLMRSIAAADPAVGFVDLSARMPAIGATAAPAWMYTDHYHPTDRGYALMADVIDAALR